MGAAVPDERGYIRNLDMVVYIMSYILDTAYKAGVNIGRQMDGRYFACIKKGGASS